MRDSALYMVWTGLLGNWPRKNGIIVFCSQNPVWRCWHNQVSVSEVWKNHKCFEFFKKYLDAAKINFLVEYLQYPIQNREQLYLVMAQLLTLLFSGSKYAYAKKMEVFCWQYLLSIFPARTKITKSCRWVISMPLKVIYLFLRTDFSNVHQNKLA